MPDKSLADRLEAARKDWRGGGRFAPYVGQMMDLNRNGELERLLRTLKVLAADPRPPTQEQFEDVVDAYRALEEASRA